MSENDTYLSLSQAASLTGKSKSVISKALKNGTLSYQEKTDSGYKIDRSELFRVFKMKTKNEENENGTPKKEQSRTLSISSENALRIKELELHLEVSKQEKNFYKDQLEKIERDRDDWKQQAKTLLLQKPEKPTQTRKGFFATLLGKTD